MVNLMRQQVHQNMPRKIALHERLAVHLYYRFQRCLVCSVTPVDKPLVRLHLGRSERWHVVIRCLGRECAPHVTLAVQRGDVIPIDDQYVIQRRPQAGKEAGAGRLEFAMRELTARGKQAMIGQSIRVCQRSKMLQQKTHGDGISDTPGAAATRASHERTAGYGARSKPPSSALCV